MSLATRCLGKKAYRTADGAWAAARKFTEDRGVPLRVYVCPDCHGHHLTSRPKNAATSPENDVAVSEELRAALADSRAVSDNLREELSRCQRKLNELGGTVGALRRTLKQAKCWAREASHAAWVGDADALLARLKKLEGLSRHHPTEDEGGAPPDLDGVRGDVVAVDVLDQ